MTPGGPPTVANAEHSILAVVFENSIPPCTAYTDCKAVALGFQQLPEMQGHGRPYAGIWRRVQQVVDLHPAGSYNVLWVPAHLTVEQAALRGFDERLWEGNKRADELAKQALALKSPPAAQLARYRELHHLLTLWCQHAASATVKYLAKCPARQRSGRLEAPVARPKRVPGDNGHAFRLLFGKRRCARCLRVAHSRAALNRLRLAPCQGSALERAAAAGLPSEPGQRQAQHALLTDGNLTWCRSCGAWAQKRPLKLRSACRPPTRAGRDALARLAKGLHPRRAGFLADVRAVSGPPFA